MKREIKFRGWDSDKKKWLSLDECAKRLSDYLLGNLYVKDRFLFTQFTGLLDKNKNEIYEGDILRIHNKEEDDGMGDNYRYTTVEYKKGAFKVEYDFGDYDMTAIGWAIDIWKDQEITCEVIGNIYEHGELLK